MKNCAKKFPESCDFKTFWKVFQEKKQIKIISQVFYVKIKVLCNVNTWMLIKIFKFKNFKIFDEIKMNNISRGVCGKKL